MAASETVSELVKHDQQNLLVTSKKQLRCNFLFIALIFRIPPVTTERVLERRRLDIEQNEDEKSDRKNFSPF